MAAMWQVCWLEVDDMSENQNQKPKDTKIKCPYCGYEMPIFVKPPAVCRGVFTKCKGRHCKKEFEIKVEI